MSESIPAAEIDVAFRLDGVLHPLVKDDGAVIEPNGVISALSTMIPERMPGKEIPSLVDDESIWSLRFSPFLGEIPLVSPRLPVLF